MKELYFLTILDGLEWFLTVTSTLLGIVASIVLIFYIIWKTDSCSNEEFPLLKSWSIGLSVSCALLCLLNVFIPNTKQASFIYGMGTVVDYVQNNKDLQQLPDKCVQALDMWVDTFIEEQNNIQHDSK